MSLVSLKELLKDTKQKKYGVGMFNAINLEMARAIILAAEEEKSPVILGFAEVHMKYTPLEMIAPIIVKAAKEAKVPVAVHFDHGMNFDLVVKAMQLGFSSVMLDCSTMSFEDNVKRTSEIVKIAKAFGVSVEAELGHIGNGEDGEDDGHELHYTEIDEAVTFTSITNIDALALSIGTAHGEYKSTPKLDIDRLNAINQQVPIPLVLHGGSGLTNLDFHNCIHNGIGKINIFTDMSIAAVNRTKKMLVNKISYPDLMLETIQGIKEEVRAKIKLFGGTGRG